MKREVVVESVSKVEWKLFEGRKKERKKERNERKRRTSSIRGIALAGSDQIARKPPSSSRSVPI
jgi:hypothetical protein